VETALKSVGWLGFNVTFNTEVPLNSNQQTNEPTDFKICRFFEEVTDKNKLVLFMPHSVYNGENWHLPSKNLQVITAIISHKVTFTLVNLS